MAEDKNFTGPGSTKINPGFKEKINNVEKTSVQNIEQPVFRPEKERNFEQIKEGKEAVRKEDIQIGQIPSGGVLTASLVSQKMQERQKRIESILAEGLEDIYAKMPPGRQQEFKIAGEQTAREINTMLSGVKFKLAKILELIKKWLSLIPGVNKYFLEQEAKIKTDEILKIKNDGDNYSI